MVGQNNGFGLTELEDLLKQVGLYQTVKTIQYGISQSFHHFYGVLKRYNLSTCTFFTPVGEMGLALHELYEFWGW